MANPSPRVFTIPASAPFLPALITALVKGQLVPGFVPSGDPLTLAGATLYLPTRRACRLARDVFLDVLGNDAAILPRIVPIGDVDEDEIAFAEAASGAVAETALDLPPALGGLARRLLLARLVLKWSEQIDPRKPGETPLVIHTPTAALTLADALARLMDDMTTRGVSWDRLDGLVPDALDTYWQLTLAFLKIARVAWPAMLHEHGAIEPASRRDRLIEAEAARLAARTDGPVIAAGSTGSMPATAKLLATIARLPHGAVVLPGLDTELDEPSWELIAGEKDGRDLVAPGHPQFAMQALLRRMEITREAVTSLAPPARHGREGLASEALRPAVTTEHWRTRLATPTFITGLDAALDSLSVVEAAHAEEEALAIAIALRETLEAPGKTAALVTPDRALARRVVAALGRWNVEVDDSGGDALTDTAAGVFARLVADVALTGVAPVALLALLKHKLFRLGQDEGGHTGAIAVLERAVLRGPRPQPGTAGLRQALAAFRVVLGKLRRKEASDLHWSDPRARLGEDELAGAADLVERLATALAPLENLSGTHPLSLLAARHEQVVAALTADMTGMPSLAGNDGEALARAFEEIAETRASTLLPVTVADYAELFRTTIGDRVVRRPEAPGVRVRILGPLEARLQTIDRVVLSGLVEGVWPPETRSDPWLSRPMRHDLGLDLPERRIGLSAHDFAQLLGAPEVILTRAAKIGGAPTVASRFLQRLAAVAGDERWAKACENGERYSAWARHLDMPTAAPKPAARPEPKPPRHARPTALSVTDIEHWLRDPYTIYAKHILRLPPLDAVDTPPGARDRGTVIHGAIGEFAQTFAEQLPHDPMNELLRLGREHFAALEAFPEARAFWWPRFQRIAQWFIGFETRRRGGIDALHAETRGAITIPLGERTFKLSARADRIERLADGDYAILDYKTGRIPGHDEVKVGFAPQLTLEAAILRAGGFDGIPRAASVRELIYVGLKGGEPAGEERAVKLKDSAPDAEADTALRKLTKIALRFEDENEAYRSLVHPMWKTRYGDYDHLARVKEWLAGGTGDDE